MKTQTLAIALLMLFVVSSLEAVWAEESIDDDLDLTDAELDTFDNEFDEIGVQEYKTRRLCKEKIHHHIEGRCSKSACRHLCKEDGYKYGKCSKTLFETINTCYCIKRCDHPALPPSPASAPESTLIAPSPASAPESTLIAPSSSPTDAPVVAPSAETPSSSPADAPKAASPAHSPSITAFETFADEEADALHF
ncbi:hypothetical protein QQ045_002186 [Rhodiola kirilowii]